MKRIIMLMVPLLAAVTAISQTFQQTNMVLDSEIPKDKTCHYEVSSWMKLMPGLRCHPTTGKSVRFSIDRFGIFPPEEGLIGGPPMSGYDGVVGALPGELNISDLGAAVYSIPVMMPQGIGGMTPQIAVTYNSQSGNGLLGWGWNLSGLSAITRVGKTMYHDGSYSAVDFTDDRFMLDGQRLMVCSGSYGANGAVYKTEIDEMSKIVSYSNGYNGPGRFKVYHKDGTIWEYGATDDSRIEPQNRNDVVLQWLVNKISDRDGNSIVFQYDESQVTGEAYIRRIDYTLNENAGIQTMYRVEFDYGSRDDYETGYVFANLVQEKRILRGINVENMMTGAVLYKYEFDYISPGSGSDDYSFMYNRLVSIGLTANGLKLNPTIISWNRKHCHYSEQFQSYPLSKNVFNKVTFTGDFNGDGYTDVITVPYKTGNTYQGNVQAEIHLNNGDGTFDNSVFYSFTFDRTLEWLYVVDFDGNGLDDIIPYYRNDDEYGTWKAKIKVYLNNGGTFSYIGEKSNYYYTFNLYPGDFCNENRTSFFLDFQTNDNYGINTPNIVYYKNGSIEMQSLGSPANQYDPQRIIAADIDGDGQSEIMYFMHSMSSVARLTKVNGSYVFNTLFTTQDLNSDDYIFMGDFNGDGYTDILKYDIRNYWAVAFFDGNRFTAPVSCLNNNLLRGVELAPQDRYVCSLENLSAPSLTIRTADFDGDGKTDVALFKNSGGNHFLEVGLKMCKSSGNTYGFTDIKRFYMSINYSHQYVHVGNFLGQENAGILSCVKSNPTTYEIPKIVAFNPHTSKYSVERITDGLGNAQGFSYEYLMPYKHDGFYEYDYQWINSNMRTVSLPAKALCADTLFSTNGNPRVTKYSYGNAVYHTKGSGLLGFESSRSDYMIGNSLFETKVVTKDIGLMDEHCVALPESVMKYNYCGQVVNEERYAYNVFACAQNDKVIIPLQILKKAIEYDLDKSNSVVRTSIENVEYQSDMSGNTYSDIVMTYKTTYGSDETYTGDDAEACSYRSVTEYSYSNNAGQWVVARPATVRQSMYYGDADAVGSCDVYQYASDNPFQITKKTSLPNLAMNYSDPLKVVTEYTYDVVGHAVTQSTATPSSKSVKVTRVSYSPDKNYRFPTTVINENGWEMQNTFDDDYGQLKSSLDYNHFATDCESDPFEITVEKSLPDGMKSVKTKRWAAGSKLSPEGALYYTWEKVSGKAETLSFFSKDGNNLRDVTYGLNGEVLYVDYTYDDYGNVSCKSMPYKEGENIRNCYYVYDKNGRLSEEVMPDGLVRYYTYNGLQRIVSSVSAEGVGQSVTETVNSEGWRTMTVDNGGNTINYTYYSDGKLKSAMIGNNPATKVEYEYDNRRNLSKMNDPACGEVLYEYDAYGQLKWTKTPRNCEIAYDYDMMGNVIRRVETDENGRNEVATQWIYDNKNGKLGTLSRIVYGNKHVVDFAYDGFLRVVSVNETIDGKNYISRYAYDGASRETSLIYPSGMAVEKQYSNSGYYRSVIDKADGKVLWRSNDADAMGYVTEYQVGNGLMTRREYDEKTNMLSGITTCRDNEVFQNMAYAYDGFGNLTERSKLTGAHKIENFNYDEFNRLTGIKLNGKFTGETVYDQYGNILSKTVDGQEVYYDAQYNGACPYAVSKVKTDAVDLNGMNQSIQYTAFDKMSKVVSGSGTLTIDYGYDRGRIRSVEVVDGHRKEKVYVGDCEYVSDNGEDLVYTLLRGPMGVFAVRVSDKKAGDAMFYIHKDHLESWCLITDAEANVIQRTSYDAWGNPRNDNTWSGGYEGQLLCDRGFTGHEHYLAFGIVNMNGRAYDPMLSMMMSPDSYIQNPDFSQNYNRYIYCFNNPLSYADPSGESVEWLLFGLFSGTVNLLLNVNDIDSWAEGLLSFGAGFLQGCLIKGFAGGSWGVQVMTSLTGNTLTDCTNALVQYNTDKSIIDWDILSSGKFKTDFKYAIGSNIATSVLSAYIVHPTEKKEGVSLSSLMSKTKTEKTALERTAGKLVGNIVSGKNLLYGFDISAKNISRIMPYIKYTSDALTEKFEIDYSDSQIGRAFDKVLTFDYQSFFSKIGNDMDYCYSQIRSLFTKTDKN